MALGSGKPEESNRRRDIYDIPSDDEDDEAVDAEDALGIPARKIPYNKESPHLSAARLSRKRVIEESSASSSDQVQVRKKTRHSGLQAEFAPERWDRVPEKAYKDSTSKEEEDV
jgi:hypothetical protein